MQQSSERLRFGRTDTAGSISSYSKCREIHVQAALTEHVSSWWVQSLLQTWETSSEELQVEKAQRWNSH